MPDGPRQAAVGSKFRAAGQPARASLKREPGAAESLRYRARPRAADADADVGSESDSGGSVPSLLEILQVLVSLSIGVSVGVTLMHWLGDAE